MLMPSVAGPTHVASALVTGVAGCFLCFFFLCFFLAFLASASMGRRVTASASAVAERPPSNPRRDGVSPSERTSRAEERSCDSPFLCQRQFCRGPGSSGAQSDHALGTGPGHGGD